MAGERIDSLTEAKRLRKEDEYQVTDVAYFLPDVKAGPAVQHGVTGTGMDGIDVDLEALIEAERGLADLHEELVGHLIDATELSGPLGDGGGPVTIPMRKAFKRRADPESGVQAALAEYLGELAAVRRTIMNTLRGYDRVNSELATQFQRQMSQLEGIV
jgi:hypothetical protein